MVQVLLNVMADGLDGCTRLIGARVQMMHERCKHRGAHVEMHEMCTRCTRRGARVDVHEVRFTRCGARVEVHEVRCMRCGARGVLHA